MLSMLSLLAEDAKRIPSRLDFRRAVEKELTGKEEEPSELIYFKVYKSPIPVIEQRSRRQRTTFV